MCVCGIGYVEAVYLGKLAEYLVCEGFVQLFQDLLFLAKEAGWNDFGVDVLAEGACALFPFGYDVFGYCSNKVSRSL